jgi:hypothetical protein
MSEVVYVSKLKHWGRIGLRVLAPESRDGTLKGSLRTGLTTHP